MEIDLKDKQNAKDYEETMNIDIENINTIENRNKVYTKTVGQSMKLYNQNVLIKLTYLRVLL